MTIKELREKAADLIEERGWAKGRYEDATGRLCILGALVVAAVPHALEIGLEQEVLNDDLVVAEAVEQLRRDLGVQHLDEWNDEKCSSADEVIAALGGQREGA